MLDEETGPGPESKKLADVITGLSEHFSFPLSAKKIAIANAITAAMIVYSPRIMAYKLRREMEKGRTIDMDKLPKPVAVPPRRPTAPEVVVNGRRQPEPTPAPPGFSMPTPANQPEVSPTYVNVAPSSLWTEPAADFPGAG